MATQAISNVTSDIMAPSSNNCTLIFWGDSYNESVATVIAARLRTAGLCVKLVGIDGYKAKGQRGITLHTDLSMNEIDDLADQTSCVIFPCDPCYYEQLERDPRLRSFWAAMLRATSHTNTPLTLVTHHGLDALQNRLQGVLQHIDFLAYPEDDALFAFAKGVADHLMNCLKPFEPYNSLSYRQLFPGHLPGIVYP